MSDEIKVEQVEPQSQSQPEPLSEYECSMCGRNGGPVVECDLCHGNPRFVQKRQFTLSEERQGKNPNAGNRYGRYGEVGPHTEQADVVLPRPGRR